MKRKILAVAAALMCVAPAVAIAQIPTHLKADYTSAYKEVRSLPAEYPAGCNLLQHKCAAERNPSAAQVRQSLAVLYDEIGAHQAATQVAQAPAVAAGSSYDGTQVSQSSPVSSTASSGSVGDSFAQCVAKRESSGNAGYNDGTYQGLYNFDQQTWQAAGGGAYAPSADQATPAQQTQVFEHWYPGHPSAWPNTGPACSGSG